MPQAQRQAEGQYGEQREHVQQRQQPPRRGGKPG